MTDRSHQILWTGRAVAEATAGNGGVEWRATGVSIDTRTLVPGDLYIALKGDRFDGHDYVADALARGAAAALVHRPVANLPVDAPILTVADTFEALYDLARSARLRTGATVLAITGSVGKTGTKEALALALADQGRTVASAGNLNNHIGAPLSLARLPQDADYAIFELGMNHANEIAPLSRLVQPDVTIITAIEPVHIENFAGIEGIADAKAEILLGQGPRGIAILNRDNPHFPRLLAHARTQGIGRIWSFGHGEGATARILSAETYASSSAVKLALCDQVIEYGLPVPGAHWVMNTAAVLAAVKAAGADPVAGAEALSRLAVPKGRGARETLALPGGPATLIDDSYNASPPSVRAAIAVLAKCPPPASGGRRILVLGDMLELGAQGEALHAGLADPIVAAGIDRVFTCGPLMRALNAALPASLRAGWASDSDALAPIVAEAIRPGDVVTVKGSLGSRMARVIDALRAHSVSAALPQPANGHTDDAGAPRAERR